MRSLLLFFALVAAARALPWNGPITVNFTVTEAGTFDPYGAYYRFIVPEGKAVWAVPETRDEWVTLMSNSEGTGMVPRGMLYSLDWDFLPVVMPPGVTAIASDTSRLQFTLSEPVDVQTTLATDGSHNTIAMTAAVPQVYALPPMVANHKRVFRLDCPTISDDVKLQLLPMSAAAHTDIGMFWQCGEENTIYPDPLKEVDESVYYFSASLMSTSDTAVVNMTYEDVALPTTTALSSSDLPVTQEVNLAEGESIRFRVPVPPPTGYIMTNNLTYDRGASSGGCHVTPVPLDFPGSDTLGSSLGSWPRYEFIGEYPVRIAGSALMRAMTVECVANSSRPLSGSFTLAAAEPLRGPVQFSFGLEDVAIPMEIPAGLNVVVGGESDKTYVLANDPGFTDPIDLQWDSHNPVQFVIPAQEETRIIYGRIFNAADQNFGSSGWLTPMLDMTEDVVVTVPYANRMDPYYVEQYNYAPVYYFLRMQLPEGKVLSLTADQQVTYTIMDFSGGWELIRGTWRASVTPDDATKPQLFKAITQRRQMLARIQCLDEGGECVVDAKFVTATAAGGDGDKKNGGPAGLGAGGIAGIAIAAIVVVALAVYFLRCRRQSAKERLSDV